MCAYLRIRGLGTCSSLLLGLALAAPAAGQFFNDGPGGPPQGRPIGAPPPVQTVKGVIGSWVRGGPARYRVVSAVGGLKSYRQQFNQEGRKLHPGFGSDRLAVVVVEIQNELQRPIEPPVFMAALTDSDGIRGTSWMLDARQQAFLEESAGYGRIRSRIPAAIAAGKTEKVAIVFSVGPSAKPVSIEFAPANFRDMRFGQGRPGNTGAAEPNSNGPPMSNPGFGGGFRRLQGPPPPVRVVIDLTAIK